MNSSDIRQKYLEFFKKRGHKIIPSNSLVPENDPTTLFTSAGMQPVLPYLLGQSHPEGKRLVDSQKCFRAQDILEVGDNRHDTFFEMLGNWSLGDYWKQEELAWLFEFLTKDLKLDPYKLYVTAFKGDKSLNLPKDEESAQIWQKLFSEVGIEAKVGERIFYCDSSKNWWSRSGTPANMPDGEPGGACSEVFFEFTNVPHNPKYGSTCHPNCECGRFLEIGNSVFMEYIKKGDSFEKLPKKNVDFGGGLERLTMATKNEPDQFKTDLYTNIIERLAEKLSISYDQHKIPIRIIADHIKASCFLIKDGVAPSNKLQGYVLRRLTRRACIKINSIKDSSMHTLPELVDPVIDIYATTSYFQTGDWNNIRNTLLEEIEKFQKTLNQGLREVKKIQKIDAKSAFDLYQTYGFPLEITEELFEEKGQTIDHAEFQKEFEHHRSISQTSSKGIFKGGLQDHSEDTKKHHTATHLLNQALHSLLGDHIIQRGSYVSADKLRFDFEHPQKLTPEQISNLERWVNEKILEDLPVHYTDLPKEQALESKALHAFNEKYADTCRIYYIGETLEGAISKEFCGGPHVEHTGELGKFKITKEESAGSGIRRIYATAV